MQKQKKVKPAELQPGLSQMNSATRASSKNAGVKRLKSKGLLPKGLKAKMDR